MTSFLVAKGSLANSDRLSNQELMKNTLMQILHTMGHVTVNKPVVEWIGDGCLEGYILADRSKATLSTNPREQSVQMFVSHPDKIDYIKSLQYLQQQYNTAKMRCKYFDESGLDVVF